MSDIKPVAWTSKKGLRALARLGFITVGKTPDRERDTPLYGVDGAEEISRLRTLLSEAEKREKEAWEGAALEEAALWHESEVKRYTAQIAENNAYLERIGSTEGSLANNYCDDQRATHRRSAAAIRALESALQSEEH